MPNINFTVILPGLNINHYSSHIKRLTASHTIEDSYQQLLNLFGLNNTPISLASLSALADGLSLDHHWLRADPMSLAVDWVHAYLLGNSHLELTEEEVAVLLSMFNQNLPEHYELIAPQSTRWYLRVPQSARINTTNPRRVLGKTITEFFPNGPDRSFWLNLINEWQMLLHSSQINQQREILNKNKIDMIWLWGEGEKPKKIADAKWHKVITDDPVAKGLAILHEKVVVDITNLKFSDWFDQCKSPGEYLIASNAYENLDPNIDLPVKSKTDLLTNIISAQQQKYIGKVTLYPDDGFCYSIRKRRRLGFRI